MSGELCCMVSVMTVVLVNHISLYMSSCINIFQCVTLTSIVSIHFASKLYSMQLCNLLTFILWEQGI
jgi:hypothetical protein